MIAVIQRDSEASVSIEGKLKSKIGKGLMILLGIGIEDSKEDMEWLGKKIIGLRIMGDAEGKMNLNISEVNGELLIISQFTLLASTKKGNRPSFINAAKPELAIPMYEQFIAFMEQEFGKPIPTGEFGADMKVSLINDGPVTITIDSKNRI